MVDVPSAGAAEATRTRRNIKREKLAFGRLLRVVRSRRKRSIHLYSLVAAAAVAADHDGVPCCMKSTRFEHHLSLSSY